MATAVSERSYTNYHKRKSQLRMTHATLFIVCFYLMIGYAWSVRWDTSIRNTIPFCKCGLSFNPYIGMPYHSLRNLLTNRCTTDTIPSMSSLTWLLSYRLYPLPKAMLNSKSDPMSFNNPQNTARSLSVLTYVTNVIMGALRTHKRCKTQEREHVMDLCLCLCVCYRNPACT
jgi:hypothetical protein